MIKRYYSIVIDSDGYILDRANNRKIIKFDFPISENELAKKICEKCLEVLNDDK